MLARKLEDALPAQTVVRRRSKRLLSREKVVEAIEVRLGDAATRCARRTAADAAREQEVRGVVIKREPLELDAWVARADRRAARAAQSSAEARAALERLVG